MKQKDKNKTGKGDIHPPVSPNKGHPFLDKKAEKYLRDSGKIEDLPEENKRSPFKKAGSKESRT